MAPTQPKARSRAEWAEVLDAIQAEVARTLQLTPELVPQLEADEPTGSVRAPLEELDRHVGEIQTCLRRAERCAAEADEVLQSDADTMRLWTEAVKKVRLALA